MTSKTSIRFEEDLLEDIDKRADELDLNRSEYLRELAKKDIYGDKFSDLPSEEDSEKSYTVKIETDEEVFSLEVNGLESQELSEDRSQAVEDVFKAYKKFSD